MPCRLLLQLGKSTDRVLGLVQARELLARLPFATLAAQARELSVESGKRTSCQSLFERCQARHALATRKV